VPLFRVIGRHWVIEILDIENIFKTSAKILVLDFYAFGQNHFQCNYLFFKVRSEKQIMFAKGHEK
jgi:hypothetical protein